MKQPEKTCCFTGHREIPSEDLAPLKKRLRKEIVSLIHNGVLYFGTGGARGFDMLAAQTILKLKKRYPQIKLIMVLPCAEHTKFWKKRDIANYQKILSKTDKVVYISKDYYPGCMDKRNRHLVIYSGYCLCYMTRFSGGTCNTVTYAYSKGLEIINCAKKR